MRLVCLLLCGILSSGAFALTTESTTVATDDAIVAAAEKIVASEPETISAKPVAKKEVPPSESDIPVFLDHKKTEKAETSLVWRLVLSFALMGVVAGALIYASKRWPKKANLGGNKARIEIMHQLNLGPRKNLSLIRVAGEVMLIGMTDHNVNLIKTITLIDDELENLTQNRFNNFLEDEFTVEDVRSALNSRA